MKKIFTIEVDFEFQDQFADNIVQRVLRIYYYFIFSKVVFLIEK
jgi:hypothetical protein